MEWLTSLLGFAKNNAPTLDMGLQLASGLMQYRQQKKADKAASIAAQQESNLILNDAARAAREELSLADKTKSAQVTSYLKSGVDLTGSPLLVMEETRRKGMENAQNILDRSKAQANLLRRQGSVKRASLINTALDVGQGMTNTYINAQLLNKQLNPASK